MVPRSIPSHRHPPPTPLRWMPTALVAVTAICLQAAALQWAVTETAPAVFDAPQPRPNTEVPFVQLTNLPKHLPALRHIPAQAVAQAQPPRRAKVQRVVAARPAIAVRAPAVVALVCDEEPLHFLQRKLDMALLRWGERAALPVQPPPTVQVQLVAVGEPGLPGDDREEGASDDSDGSDDEDDDSGQPPDPPDEDLGADALLVARSP